MSEMVNKVATMLVVQWRKTSPPAMAPDPEYWRDMARVAIEAMREPTEAMDAAGDVTFGWQSDDATGHDYSQSADATYCWQTMIDAALK